MESWRVIVDSPSDAASQMARDAALAKAVRGDPSSPPILRLYRWEGQAITLGRRMKPEDLPEPWASRKLPMANRPTGGAAVVHRPDELTYAVAIGRARPRSPVPLAKIPRLIHQRLREVLVEKGWFAPEELRVVPDGQPGRSDTFCFNAPVCGDLIYRDRKVAGAALRAWQEGILIQGSIQGLPLALDRLEAAFLQALTGDLNQPLFL